ncbi:hypothetical protein Trydic_g15614 [Trypoxylus dichotomus]
MSDHNSAVFNHSCLKPPRNPLNHQPFPVYDQKHISRLVNEVEKLNVESSEFKMKSTSPSEIDKSTLRSFIEFYDSIPDYNDINHLSNKEFYRKLELLKEKQRNYYEYVHTQNKCLSKERDWIEDYKNLSIREASWNREKSCDKQVKSKPFCVTPILSKPTISVTNVEDRESLISSDKDIKPPSRRSVRIESPSDKFFDENSPEPYFRSKSRANISSAESKGFNTANDSFWDELSFDECCGGDQNLTTRSAPNTPTKSKPNVGWKDGITVPKPFEMTVRDEENKIVDDIVSKNRRPVVEKHEMFKAHPVPIESQIPLFDKIMNDQEKRALQKKVRAEEMLRAASLPPSMALREKKKPRQHLCPRTYRDFNIDENLVKEIMAVQSNRQNKSQRKEYINRELRELEKLENEFIKRSPKYCKNKRKSKVKRGRQSSAESKSTMRSTPTLEAMHRSNLAAVLRVQSARKRIELEMCKKLEEAKLREETRWREKIMRKRPVWQELAYSHEEDLAMRLQMRRDEERLRSEEHKQRMQLMLGRVNQQPTLFERQSQVKNAKTREELITKLYKDIGIYSNNSLKSSDSDVSDKKHMVQMKDEAIQAHFDDIFKREEECAINGRDNVMPKCHCDIDDKSSS